MFERESIWWMMKWIFYRGYGYEIFIYISTQWFKLQDTRSETTTEGHRETAAEGNGVKRKEGRWKRATGDNSKWIIINCINQYNLKLNNSTIQKRRVNWN